MQEALKDSARAADRFAAREMPAWQRPVKVVDGTSVQLPDTDEKRARYPYPSGQKPGCGFPVMGVLAIQSLGSGAMLHAVDAPWSAHDFRLFLSAWGHFEPGDIIMGDRAFCAYAAMALLPMRRVDMVARLHQARTVNLRQAKRIGESEWLVTWKRPPQHKGQAMRISPSPQKARKLYNRPLEIIARDAVPLRPNRSEPRAVKKGRKTINASQCLVTHLSKSRTDLAIRWHHDYLSTIRDRPLVHPSGFVGEMQLPD